MPKQTIFSCPQCGTRIGVPEELVGGSVTCNGCGTTFGALRDDSRTANPTLEHDSASRTLPIIVAVVGSLLAIGVTIVLFVVLWTKGTERTGRQRAETSKPADAARERERSTKNIVEPERPATAVSSGSAIKRPTATGAVETQGRTGQTSPPVPVSKKLITEIALRLALTGPL